MDKDLSSRFNRAGKGKFRDNLDARNETQSVIRFLLIYPVHRWRDIVIDEETEFVK